MTNKIKQTLTGILPSAMGVWQVELVLRRCVQEEDRKVDF